MSNAKDVAARNLLLKQSYGVLSTISVDLPGYPFGSVTPYCVDRDCQPIIYTSYIAQHTKNILADPKVSLTVLETTDASDDVQAHGRVTCLANARPVEDDAGDIAERYFRYIPTARDYHGTHDFAFFRLELVRVRFIGGFGQIYWVEPKEFLLKNPFSPVEELRILQHMNKDHADALKHYTGGNDALMIGIDADGFDMLSGGNKVRMDFDAPVHNMEEARQALVALARR